MTENNTRCYFLPRVIIQREKENLKLKIVAKETSESNVFSSRSVIFIVIWFCCEQLVGERFPLTCPKEFHATTALQAKATTQFTHIFLSVNRKTFLFASSLTRSHKISS